MSTDPFTIADRYITMKKQCLPPSWVSTLVRLNEMLVAPVIALFLVLTGEGDMMRLIPMATTAYTVWSEWIEFQELRFHVQRLYLVSALVGGPFIRTNDPEYEPYVYADAVVRAQTGMLTRGRLRLPQSRDRPLRCGQNTRQH
jgi:hypothetical protein